MNREERRQKRQRDTKNAMIIFSVFVLVLVVLTVGGLFALNQLVLKKKPAEKPVAQTEQPEEGLTDTAGDSQAPEPQPETPEPVIDPLSQQAIDFVAGMSLEDKVAQMFMITPNALTGFGGVTVAGDTTRSSYQARPVGGLIYTSENLLDGPQTNDMMTKMMAIAKERTNLPIFLGVDEEGGSVTRIAGNSAFGLSDVGDMSAIGATGDAQNAHNAGTTIGTYLKQLGFNVNFAPVADVLTNPENSVIGKRSFGADSTLVADMVAAELQGLSEQGIYGVVKHFPGHGGVSGDSHQGVVTSEKTLEELTATELVPFARAIESGVSFIMAGHIALPNITGDNTPASLSQKMVTEILRGQMGYNGIVITDGMNMGAITSSYTSDQAAVMAIPAGVDIILMPQDYKTAYDAVIAAVGNGTISEARINESVVRIVKVKLQMNK